MVRTSVKSLAWLTSAVHRGREREVPSLVLRALRETHLPSDRALALEAVQVGGADVPQYAALSVKPRRAGHLH